MKIVTAEHINKNTPSFVINPEALIYKMDDYSDDINVEKEYHRTFLPKVIKNLTGIEPKEDNLEILNNILLNDLNCIIYYGCTEKTRKFSGGYILLKDLTSLTNEQLMKTIDIYSKLGTEYDLTIEEVSYQEKEISIGEVYEELLNRDNKIK